jgi:hypothetical protein
MTSEGSPICDDLGWERDWRRPLMRPIRQERPTPISDPPGIIPGRDA